MNIIVTGSTGFVGRHLIPLLIHENHRILELTRNPQLSCELFSDTTEKFDVSSGHDQMIESIRKFQPDILIHLASFLTSADDYESSLKLINSNITYLNEVLSTLKNSTLSLFINTGTFAEYFKGDGNLEPAYLYAATKTASRYIIDYYANSFDFKYINVIPYTIYGGIDKQKKIIDYIFDSLDSKNALDLSPGEQVLDFIHINDVVDFYSCLIKNHPRLSNQSVIYLGSGIGHNLQQVAQLFEEITRKKANINWGGKSYRLTDVMYAVADISYQFHLFNWRPKISLKQGIQLYIENKSI
ncbi:NAD(P)-dependent oxidoreductase [Mucilaginibacter sp.]|uniref:NAD-dependent epimerase/dehydratase family protein n=1 Tax=Mucilaginibacter sp. TaxID=1882438 RepID=UPI00284C16EE|nr:NAD(P)-dependent oxidoreductase [Mucilaginibacter sp.]MDR3696337.1 NAD(P)-dependent oxidoreductase [Mucilaginibacter sp.]